MVYGGVNHFLHPDMYAAFVPSFLSFTYPIIYGSGALEILLGILLVIPRYTYIAAYGLFALMILFLPIHIMDIFLDAPAIGSKTAAYIRLPLQFLLIALTWKFTRLSGYKK